MTDLAGRRVLIAENEFLVALVVEDILAQLGIKTVGPVPSVSEALKLVQREQVDAAVIDAELRDGAAYPLVAELRSRNVPCVVTSASAIDPLPAAFKDCLIILKPFRLSKLAEALSTILSD